MTASRQIFIGDLQGCYDECMDLLAFCEYDASRDDLYLAGDMINRGPKSREIMLWLMRHPEVKAILGNHEHFYLYGEDHKGKKRKKNFRKLDEAFGAERDLIVAYLMQQPYAIETDDWLLVHGGLPLNQHWREATPEALTTMRYLEDDRPWYEALGVNGQKPIIFGHWAMRGLVEHGPAIGLDSGCVYGGSLTAYILPEKRFLSVPAKKVYCKPKPK